MSLSLVLYIVALILAVIDGVMKRAYPGVLLPIAVALIALALILGPRLGVIG